MNPTLSQAVTIHKTAKSLTCLELGTRYRALSADATTAYGLSPTLVIHDELGQVRGPRSALCEARHALGILRHGQNFARVEKRPERGISQANRCLV